MNCDRCAQPSAGPRCPRCVHTYGPAPHQPSGLVVVGNTSRCEFCGEAIRLTDLELLRNGHCTAAPDNRHHSRDIRIILEGQPR